MKVSKNVHLAQYNSMLTNTRKMHDSYIIFSFLLHFSQIQNLYKAGVSQIEGGAL